MVPSPILRGKHQSKNIASLRGVRRHDVAILYISEIATALSLLAMTLD